MIIRIIALTLACLVLSCKSAPREEDPIVQYSKDELKKRTFQFFWDAIDSNYQTYDRYPTLTFSSIAATGFGLSSYIVGIENEYISRSEGAERTLKTLNKLWNLPQSDAKEGIGGHKGFFYHFLKLSDATRFKQVELSSIDTGLLMAGVLSCMSYYTEENPTEIRIRQLSEDLYKRVEWDWMMKKNDVMRMGWHPEKGFLDAEWSGYNEAMVLIIMAMGSPTHPIADNAWQKWCQAYEFGPFYDKIFLQFDPLFGHQYSHIWIDFRGIQDSFMQSHSLDYFENSKMATITNRQYCITNPMAWKGYGENCWGLTACDGPKNGPMVIDGTERTFFDYRARGAAAIQIIDDGTIAPTAAGGSYAFTPQISDACLANMWNTHYKDLVGTYGFKDAFNLTYMDADHPEGWFDIDYLGIDQGPILLMMENHDTELIWNIMKKNPYILKGLERAGFQGGWLTKVNNVDSKK